MKPHILIVDDDCQLLEVCTKIFQAHNFQVTTFDTVKDAINNIKKVAYDVAVVDIRFNDKPEGLTIIDEIKAYSYVTQIIVVTGFGNLRLAKQVIRRGVADFIEKSGDFQDDLLASVNKCIDNKKELERRRGNPFVNRTGELSKVFGGLNAELDIFEKKVDQAIFTSSAQHFLVLGQDCMGKTALLQEFKKISRKRGHLAAYIPMVRLKQQDESAMNIMEVLVKGIYSNLPQGTEKLKRFWKYLESAGVSVLGTGFNFSRFKTQESHLHFFLAETFERLWKDLSADSNLLLILIDDVNYIIDTQPDSLIILKQALSYLNYEKTKILVVLACSNSRWSFLTSQNEYRALGTYFFSKINAREMNKEETDDWIRSSINETGVDFNPLVKDLVWEYTKGHPFISQVLCYNLFESQLNGVVDESTWEKSYINTMHEVGDSIYNGVFKDLTSQEINILRCLVCEEKSLEENEIKKCLIDVDSNANMSTVHNLLDSLCDKQILYRSSKSRIKFVNNIIKDYFREKESAYN